MTAGYLGHRAASGFLNPDNPIGSGCYSAVFTPTDLYTNDFLVYHISLVGPGGPFRVYIDTRFYSASSRGDLNEWDPVNPMYVRRGESIWFHWLTSTGTQPMVTIYTRQPGEVLL